MIKVFISQPMNGRTEEQYRKYGDLIYNKLKESGFYDGDRN